MPRRNLILALVLAIAAAALVSATRSAQQSGDSLSYAYAAREGEGLVHPHHLAFVPVLRALYLTTAGGAAEPSRALLTVAQVHGALWAGVGVAAAFMTLVALGFSTVGAAAGAAALLFAQGYWVLSTHASPYVPSVACMACAVAVLTGGGTAGPSARRLALASVPWAAAVLFHQVNALYVVPLVVGLVAVSPRRAPRSIPAAVVPAGVLVFVVYLVTFLATVNTWTALRFARFVTRYAHGGRPQWGTLRNVEPEGVQHLLRNQTWNVLATPGASAGAAALLFALVVVGLLGWHVATIVRGGDHRGIRVLLLTWLLSFWASFLWWVPSETKLYSLTLLPLILLGTLAGRDVIHAAIPEGRGRRAARYGAAAVVLAIGLFHLLSVILPAHTRAKPAFLEAKRIAAVVPGPCAALVDYEVAQSLRYYFDWRSSAPASAALVQASQDRKLDAIVPIRDSACVVADFDAFLPSRDTHGFDADREPVRWLRLLEWLLGVERGADGAIVACRELDVVATGPGNVYLRIGPGRLEIDGLRGLCERLDVLGGDRAPGFEAEFTRWHERHRRVVR